MRPCRSQERRRGFGAVVEHDCDAIVGADSLRRERRHDGRHVRAERGVGERLPAGRAQGGRMVRAGSRTSAIVCPASVIRAILLKRQRAFAGATVSDPPVSASVCASRRAQAYTRQHAASACS